MSSILCDALLKSYIPTYWDVCFLQKTHIPICRNIGLQECITQNRRHTGAPPTAKTASNENQRHRVPNTNPNPNTSLQSGHRTTPTTFLDLPQPSCKSAVPQRYPLGINRHRIRAPRTATPPNDNTEERQNCFVRISCFTPITCFNHIVSTGADAA